MIICKLHKTYHTPKKSFVLDIDASFKLNAINVLFGPSGAGKTSLLRLLSGLDSPDKGSILVNDVYWLQTATKTNVPVHKRNIAYVVQDYGLFANMTVLNNLKFVKKHLNQELLNNVISTLEIKHLLMIKPNDLSGGQKQRVALARALVQEPQLLLLDEPLTALDEELRYKLQDYLIQLQQQYQFTVIMVSHNLQEVLKVAEHVCVINDGKITKQGNPNLLIPRNSKNTLKGTVLDIEDDMVSILIGVQQIKISKKQITTSNFNRGDVIDLQL